MIERMNAFLGRTAIQSIRFRVGDVTPVLPSVSATPDDSISYRDDFTIPAATLARIERESELVTDPELKSRIIAARQASIQFWLRREHLNRESREEKGRGRSF